MQDKQQLLSLRCIGTLLAALTCCSCQNSCQSTTPPPGAATPQLIAVYANVSQGTLAPVSNGQYIVMPSVGMVLDVKIPFPTTLAIELTYPHYFDSGCSGGILTSPPPPDDPATVAMLGRNPGFYHLEALNNVATDPFVIYRVTVHSTWCFDSLDGLPGDPGELSISDIPAPGHSGASNAPPLIVYFNAPASPQPPQPPQTPTCVVPKVVGDSMQQALGLISQANLQPTIYTLSGTLSVSTLVVTSQSPNAGGPPVACGAYVSIWVMPGAPQNTGYRGLQIWNCNQDQQAIELYLVTDGGSPADQGSMPSQWQNGACLTQGTQPGKTISFQTSHQYQVIEVNSNLPGCGSNDPSNNNCVPFASQVYRGNSNGPMYQLSLP